MKYIDAEKLIAEIERRIKLIPLNFVEVGSYPSAEAMNQKLRNGLERQLNSIKDFITSLQQEQSEVDLEKEIDRYFNPHGMALQFDRSKGNTILKPEQLIKFACHFAGWGAIHLNARKEESNEIRG